MHSCMIVLFRTRSSSTLPTGTLIRIVPAGTGMMCLMPVWGSTERSFTENGEVHIRIQALNAYQALIDLFVKRFTSRLEV